MPVLYSLFFSLAQTRIEPSVDQRRRQSWAALAPGQSHVSSMNNLRVASQLQSYPSHIAYVYLELHL
jgi:hypothetical protein